MSVPLIYRLLNALRRWSEYRGVEADHLHRMRALWRAEVIRQRYERRTAEGQWLRLVRAERKRVA